MFGLHVTRGVYWILWETLVKQVEPAHRKLKVRRSKQILDKYWQL